MSKTWSYTRVPRRRGSRLAGGGPSAGIRRNCPDIHGPQRFFRRRMSPVRLPRSVHFYPGCNISHTYQPERRSSPVRGGIWTGCWGPERREHDPRSALSGARYVLSSAQAAGRGKINAQKKPRGVTPEAMCPALVRFRCGCIRRALSLTTYRTTAP